MDNDKSSYRQIFKATSLFGGVQIFNILLSIIRSKLIAVLLGPTGMGIAGLFTTTISLIVSLTNFGLGTSAIKDIAAANESTDKNRISYTITIFRRLVWITGFFGVIVTFILAGWLSQTTFGTKDYAFSFRWLSLTLLFTQLTSGQDVLLQGMRKLQSLAKANMIGSLLGLLISIPLYYFFKLQGIVPAMFITSVSLMFIAWYFARNITIDKINLSNRDAILGGKEMLRMGIMLSLSSLITIGSSYLIRIFISNTGGMKDVGLYSAGFAIIGTYVGLVFTAMSTDFYPRLSGVAHDNKKASLLINQQGEIAILILAPILTVFFIFINQVIVLLYSNEFIQINGMIHWAALGMYFKAASWSIGFILLAKGDSKTFFFSELLANIYILIFNIFGYKFLGLNGMGISFLISYILVLLQVYLIAKFKYQFSFESGFFKIFIIQFLFGLCCFCVAKFTSSPLTYLIGIPIICASTCFSYIEMDKRIGFKNLFAKYKRK